MKKSKVPRKKTTNIDVMMRHILSQAIGPAGIIRRDVYKNPLPDGCRWVPSKRPAE